MWERRGIVNKEVVRGLAVSVCREREGEHARRMDPSHYNLSYEEIKAIHERTCARIEHPRKFYAVVTGVDAGYEFLKESQVRQVFATDYLGAGVRFAPSKPESRFISKWIKDPTRRTCSAFVVDPSSPMGPVRLGEEGFAFNLFRGFRAARLAPVDARDVVGLVAPLVGHVHEVMAGGSAERTEWFLNWLAGMVQRPEIKTKVGVVVNGPCGCGKGILVEFFRRGVLGMECSYQSANASRYVSAEYYQGLPGAHVFFVGRIHKRAMTGVCGRRGAGAAGPGAGAAGVERAQAAGRGGHAGHVQAPLQGQV